MSSHGLNQNQNKAFSHRLNNKLKLLHFLFYHKYQDAQVRVISVKCYGLSNAVDKRFAGIPLDLRNENVCLFFPAHLLQQTFLLDPLQFSFKRKQVQLCMEILQEHFLVILHLSTSPQPVIFWQSHFRYL